MVEGGGWLRALRALGPSGRAIRRAATTLRVIAEPDGGSHPPPATLLHVPAGDTGTACSKTGGGRWIRTTEGVSQQIYSLPPLAAWVSLRREPVIFAARRLFVNDG